MIRFASIISVKRLEFRWWSRSSPEPTGPLVLDGLEVPIVWRKNPLAKRYRLFIDRSGNPRVTIPRREMQLKRVALLKVIVIGLTPNWRSFGNDG